MADLLDPCRPDRAPGAGAGAGPLTALRCRSTTHAIGGADGTITRLCRDCSRAASDAATVARVYHTWRLDGATGRWEPVRPDETKRTARPPERG